MTSPFFRPLMISTSSPLALAELHVAALGLGLFIVGVDEPDVLLVCVVLVVVDGGLWAPTSASFLS